jgi:hypothetical protein
VSGLRYDRTLILASIIFALLIAATPDTLAQDATFNERYPTKQTPAQGAPEQVSRPALEATPRIAEAKSAKSGRVASTKPPAAQVVVEPRSFLDAGTEVLPGQRKFLDYALPPTHIPTEVVQNTGGRVGWHLSPLPGPFFPW